MITALQRARIEVLALSAALAVGICACGSSSKSSASRSDAASASSTAPASSAKIHAVLTGQDHTPKATEPWTYTVRVTSAAGKPLPATVETEFAFGGQVVGRESPPSHRMKNGVLKDKVEFPKQAVGQPLSLQVVVHTSAGTRTLDWPVTVKP